MAHRAAHPRERSEPAPVRERLRPALRLARRIPKRAIALVATAFIGAAGTAAAGNLRIYEVLAPSQQTRTLAGPLTNFLIDVDYAPNSAEGAKLYGMSEVQIETTGNLVLTPTGFACQAVPCLYSPNPFVAGKKVRLTAGNDLAGETTATANFFTIGLTGSVGHVLVSRGEYIDGTRPGSAAGAIQSLDAKVLVTVPEPTAAIGLAAACALLVGAHRRRARRLPLTTARA